MSITNNDMKGQDGVMAFLFTTERNVCREIVSLTLATCSDNINQSNKIREIKLEEKADALITRWAKDIPNS